ncbi:MAG: Holliday junction branch migration protein RuvA [Chloroflexota bacterium]|nr:Holliday junction branch migration protein RuvA [Chloroflexota bacterium]
MIASVTGRLEARGSDHLILSVDGVGFKIFVPTVHLDEWSRPGQEVTLHTYLHVRESELTLYGFPDPDERNLFEVLISVSRVGPKLALAILSSLSTDTFRAAIVQGRREVLSRVPGIGDKTARRLIFHLRDKIELQKAPEAAPMLTDADAELIAALTNLGYSISEAQAAVQNLPPDEEMPVEERVRRALAYFGGG